MSTYSPSTPPRIATHPDEVPAGSIVVGVHDSLQPAAADWAIDQAALEQRPLTLVHAAGPTWAERYALYPTGERAELIARAEAVVDPVAQRAAERSPDLRVTRLAGIEGAAQLLVDLSERASMIVLGSHGRGPVGSVVLGSVGVTVSHRAACPVLVHRPTTPGIVRQGVLVAVDATEHSRVTLEAAFEIASLRDLPLTVVHSRFDADAAAVVISAYGANPAEAMDEERSRRFVAESLAGLREDHPDVHTTVTMTSDPVAVALRTMGSRMDLIVVGRGGPHAYPASTATAVVEHAICPVLVVP